MKVFNLCLAEDLRNVFHLKMNTNDITTLLYSGNTKNAHCLFKQIHSYEQL